MIRILGLASDRPGAGKTTAADYLTMRHSYQQISIGQLVKREVDAMTSVHGVSYDESRKEEFRDGLIWWTDFRLRNTSATYWVDALERALAAADGPVVVTDVRYPDEAQRVRARGGIVVKIARPGVARHAGRSEIALDHFDFDAVIDNSREDDGQAMFAQLDGLLGEGTSQFSR